MYEQTKGRKVNANKNAKSKEENLEDDNKDDPTKKWAEGTESEMFNKLEEVSFN